MSVNPNPWTLCSYSRLWTQRLYQLEFFCQTSLEDILFPTVLILHVYQVQEIAEKQCRGLEEQIKELIRHSDDDDYAGLNRLVPIPRGQGNCNNYMWPIWPADSRDEKFAFLHCIFTWGIEYKFWLTYLPQSMPWQQICEISHFKVHVFISKRKLSMFQWRKLQNPGATSLSELLSLLRKVK